MSERDNVNIALLGSGGSGKTVFFATLSYVLMSPKYSNLTIEYIDGIGYIRQIRDYLESGQWPAKTLKGEIYPLSAIIYKKKLLGTKVYHLQICDIAGEDFDEFCDPNKSASDGVSSKYSHLLTSSAHIWLMDPSRISKDMWKYIRLIQHLVNFNNIETKERINVPIAVVLTKHDIYRHIVNPEDYVRENAPDLYHLLMMRANVHKIGFFCSSIGETTSNGPRLPLAPTGFSDVIEFILHNA